MSDAVDQTVKQQQGAVVTTASTCAALTNPFPNTHNPEDTTSKTALDLDASNQEIELIPSETLSTPSTNAVLDGSLLDVKMNKLTDDVPDPHSTNDIGCSLASVSKTVDDDSLSIPPTTKLTDATDTTHTTNTTTTPLDTVVNTNEVVESEVKPIESTLVSVPTTITNTTNNTITNTTTTNTTNSTNESLTDANTKAQINSINDDDNNSTNTNTTHTTHPTKDSLTDADANALFTNNNNNDNTNSTNTNTTHTTNPTKESLASTGENSEVTVLQNDQTKGESSGARTSVETTNANGANTTATPTTIQTPSIITTTTTNGSTTISTDTDKIKDKDNDKDPDPATATATVASAITNSTSTSSPSTLTTLTTSTPATTTTATASTTASYTPKATPTTSTTAATMTATTAKLTTSTPTTNTPTTNTQTTTTNKAAAVVATPPVVWSSYTTQRKLWLAHARKKIFNDTREAGVNALINRVSGSRRRPSATVASSCVTNTKLMENMLACRSSVDITNAETILEHLENKQTEEQDDDDAKAQAAVKQRLKTSIAIATHLAKLKRSTSSTTTSMLYPRVHTYTPPTQATMSGGAAAKTSLASRLQSQLECFRTLRQNKPVNTAVLRAIDIPPTNVATNLEIKELERANRMRCRANELQSLPITIPTHLSIRAQIELRGLSLLEHQRKLREEIKAVKNPFSSTRTTLCRNINFVKRKPFIRTAEFTNDIEQLMEEVKFQRAEEKHEEFLRLTMQHSTRFRAFHRNKVAERFRSNRNLTTFFSQSAKMRDKLEQTRERERMQMLMNEDEEGYRAMIDKEKDKRLTYLLDQTDDYMKSLMSEITKHQMSEVEQEQSLKVAAEAAKKAELEKEKNANTDNDDLADGGVLDTTVDSFKNAAAGQSRFGPTHRICEKVRQPSIMVNGKLKEYQVIGLEWMVSLFNNKLNGILADEMGLGKTIQTIALITYLKEYHQENGPYLVIVPLSTLANWVMEFKKWAPDIIVVQYRGTPPVRKKMAFQVQQGNFNVLLTTYEFIIRDQSVLAKVPWKLTVVDEGHRMKNSNSKLSKIFMENYKSPRRILLTGTPLQNNLPELWALLNFLLPTIFKSSETFEDWFSAPFAGTNENLSMSEEEKMLVIQRLHKVLRPFMIRRLKKDVEKQLPDKVEHVIRCDMSMLQRRLYRFLKLHNVLLTEEPLLTSAKAGGHRALHNRIMQLRKICNHPYLYPEVEAGISRYAGAHKADLWRVSGKFEILTRILPKLISQKHRVLLFCQMTNVMTIMEDFFISFGIKYLRLDGGTKSEDRGGLLELFNAPNSAFDVFMLSTRAGGLGLNLQTADTVIIFDSDWNPHQDLQAQDRAHRIGQQKQVRVFRLITANSVDEHILAAARFKLNMDSKVIQAGMFNHSANTKMQRDYLQKILEEEELDDDEEEIYGESANDELNMILARNDEELKLYQEHDEQRAKEDAKEWMDDTRRSRLMQSHELPPWALVDDSQVAEMVAKKDEVVDPMTTGRGARERKVVTYADTLSEQQFLNAVEDGTLEEVEKKVTEKIKKRKRKEIDANNPTREADEKKAANKRKLEQKEEEELQQRLSTISPEIRQQLTLLVEAISTHTDREGSFTVTSIATPPTKAADPAYHKKVVTPISLENIKLRTTTGIYQTISALETDVKLMTTNVLRGCTETAHHDAANIIANVFDETKKRLAAAQKRKRKLPQAERS